MISTTPKLTTAGTSLLIRALAGEAITFTGFKIGNGDPPSDPDSLTDLINPLLSFGVSGLDRSQDGQVILRGRYDNSQVQSEFRVKEFGIFAQGETVSEFTSTGSASFTISAKPMGINSVTINDETATVSSYNQSTGVVTLTDAPTAGAIVKFKYPDGTNLLYAYTNDGANAGMIRAYASDVVSEENITVYLEISNEATVTAYLTPDAAYVLKSEYEEHLNATNPHGLTANDIGLGDVDNVHLAEYELTFTEAESFENIESGTTFSVIFGKIKKAISTLTSHINNKKNPHNVTVTQIGAAATEHNHSAADINSGVLSIERGGTSVTTIGELRNLLGQPVIGVVIGDGVQKRHIDLDFEPVAVLYVGEIGVNCVHLALKGHASVSSSCSDRTHQTEWHHNHTLLMIDETGFFINGYASISEKTNLNNAVYRYIAFR